MPQIGYLGLIIAVAGLALLIGWCGWRVSGRSFVLVPQIQPISQEHMILRAVARDEKPRLTLRNDGTFSLLTPLNGMYFRQVFTLQFSDNAKAFGVSPDFYRLPDYEDGEIRGTYRETKRYIVLLRWAYPIDDLPEFEVFQRRLEKRDGGRELFDALPEIRGVKLLWKQEGR